MTKSLITICGWLLCVCVTPLVVAQEEQKSPSESIRINVVLVHSTGELSSADRKKLNGETSAVFKSLESFKESGKLQVINDTELVLIDNTNAMFQLGATVPIRTGSSRSVGGRETKVYQDVSVGTLVNLKAKIVDDGIAVNISFAKSAVRDDLTDDAAPQGVSRLSHQASLGIKDGTAQLMGGMAQRGSDDSDQGAWLIVSAERLSVAGKQAKSDTVEDQSVIGDVQIEVVPELGTIVLRGKSEDVKRVQAIIGEIEKRKKESESK